MSYNYQNERARVFTEQGQVQFLRIRDRIRDYLKIAGACSVEAAIMRESGDTFLMLACIDRLEELGEISVVTHPNSAWKQHKIIVGGPNG